ncbi:class I SAM-dependent methyltransferase [Streptomyces sp. NPDC047014]|uniref:SAM-dependent methyltransferase n=1 Tax=Streptomyces sp. NPDC047014 TaxID=3155736 RepID=UPI0033C2C812
MPQHDHDHAHQHEPHAGAATDGPAPGGEQFWDERYSEQARIWSGRPNDLLVREAQDLTPGRALDLGCGEGGDTVWLARRGWRVTATDISKVALGRAAEHAAEAGVEELVDWQRHDFSQSFPEGEFDLVSACFLHSYGDFPRDRILRRAAAAVAPGGVLLVVGHAGGPSWNPEALADIHFPTPQEVLEQLELPEGGWQVLTAAEIVQPMTDPEGRPATRPDNVLTVRRAA